MARNEMMLVAAGTLVASALAAGLRPEPEITVSQWADQHRLVGKPSPEPGPWRTDRVAYAREIMDRLSPSDPAQFVIFMAAAQGAKTEIGLNQTGCRIHRYPTSMMLVQPTTGTAKKFVRTRLDPFFEINPALSAVVSPARSRGASNTLELKDFVGGQMMITGANSGAGLRSYPAEVLWMDEVDAYPVDLDGEGDPTELAIQRTATFPHRKILMTSTPTLEVVSLILKWFNRGDQNYYFIPCPLCGFEQRLVWGADRAREGRLGGIRWPKGQPDHAKYQCEKCGDQFEEWRKIDSIRRGVWVPSKPGNGGVLIRSYQINSLYYPYGWPENAWTNLAAKWDADHKDQIKLKTFVNLKLGEPWSDPAEAKVSVDALMSRRENYGPQIPSRACLLTAFVDVQGDRLEAELVAWGPDDESWGMEYHVFPGDTSQLTSDCWAALDRFIAGEWLHETGVQMSIRGVGIDAGYNGQQVKAWVSQHSGRRIWATLGRDGQRPVWPIKRSKQRGKYPPPIIVGVDAAKEKVYSDLRVKEPGPGFQHFPATYDRHYFEMLLAEIRVPDYSGPIPRYIWRLVKEGARNEALDCRAGNYAVRVALETDCFLRLPQELDAIRRRAESGKVAPISQATPRWRDALKPIVSDNPYL